MQHNALIMIESASDFELTKDIPCLTLFSHMSFGYLLWVLKNDCVIKMPYTKIHTKCKLLNCITYALLIDIFKMLYMLIIFENLYKMEFKLQKL